MSEEKLTGDKYIITAADFVKLIEVAIPKLTDKSLVAKSNVDCISFQIETQTKAKFQDRVGA